MNNNESPIEKNHNNHVELEYIEKTVVELSEEVDESVEVTEEDVNESVAATEEVKPSGDTSEENPIETVPNEGVNGAEPTIEEVEQAEGDNGAESKIEEVEQAEVDNGAESNIEEVEQDEGDNGAESNIEEVEQSEGVNGAEHIIEEVPTEAPIQVDETHEGVQTSPRVDQKEREHMNLNVKSGELPSLECIDLDTRIEIIHNDIPVNNSSIKNIDYTNTLYNGTYCKVLACEEIIKYNTVEKLIYNGKLCVKHTDPLTTNLFLGIAQNDAKPGEIVDVLTSGISIMNVRNRINLPLLKHNSQGQLSIIRDKNNQYITQSICVPINKNDLLVLSGTSNDILGGPLTRYYQFNTSNCRGLLSPYKSIVITNNLVYNINYNDQNTILHQKVSYGNKLIQILDINIETNEITGYLH